MRRANEILLVIAAAGLAAVAALIEIPTHSADPGTVVGGGSLFAGSPSTTASTLPPLPPLLFPPGSSTPVPIQPPTPTGEGLPLVSGVGGLIQSISPISRDDTTPPAGPVAVPGVPAPAGVTQPPGTTPPPSTTPPSTSPPTTAPPTTDPPTTAPPTTDPLTTAPPTTDPPTTTPPTTDPVTTAPPTTEPSTTEPPTSAPPTTAPPTTS